MSSIFEISQKEVPECGWEITIPDSLVLKWQASLEEMARITGASVNLILVKSKQGIEICASNKGSRNIFSKTESIYGYIDTFTRLSIETDSKVLISDVARDSNWNPDHGVIHSLRSYLGLPLHWLNKTVFGVLCALSEDTYYFKITYEKIMEKYRNSIEADLRRIFI